MKNKFRQAVFILVVLVGLAGLHLFIYTNNINLKYQLTDAKIKLNELVSQNRLLGCQVAQKENLAYVEKMAKDKLNMVEPGKINYLFAPKPKTPASN